MSDKQGAPQEAQDRQAAAVAAQEAVDAIQPTPTQEELNRVHLGVDDEPKRKEAKPAEPAKPSSAPKA